jgi:hypothetical protein
MAIVMKKRDNYAQIVRRRKKKKKKSSVIEAEDI